MPHLTPEQVVDIAARGKFDELKGTVEDHQIEAKAEPYADNPHGRLELAKDVSGLANAGGGVIIIGARTERLEAEQQDAIVDVRPFVQGLVNVEQYLARIRTGVFPPPQGVDIRWYQSSVQPDRGILLIVVPKQPDEERPFLIARVVDAETGRVREIVFGYAERRRANTEPLGVRDLQELLRAGRRFGEIGPRLDRMEELLKRRPTEAAQSGRAAEPPVPDAPPQPPPLAFMAARRNQALMVAGLQQQPAVAFATVPDRQIEIPRSFGGRGSPVYDLLENPPLLRYGSFHIGGGRNPIIVGGQVYRSAKREELLEVWEDGTILAVGDGSDRLCWGTRRTQDAPLRINPLALVETAYLFVDWTRRLYGLVPQPPAVMFVMSLHQMQVAGRKALLTPHGRRTAAFQHRMGEREAPDENGEFKVIWPGGAPPETGRVAYGILRRLYLWFGFNEDEIPYVEEMPDGQRVISRERIIEDGQQP
jgi:hypothetical protein